MEIIELCYRYRQITSTIFPLIVMSRYYNYICMCRRFLNFSWRISFWRSMVRLMNSWNQKTELFHRWEGNPSNQVGVFHGILDFFIYTHNEWKQLLPKMWNIIQQIPTFLRWNLNYNQEIDEVIGDSWIVSGNSFKRSYWFSLKVKRQNTLSAGLLHTGSSMKFLFSRYYFLRWTKIKGVKCIQDGFALKSPEKDESRWTQLV